MALSLPLLVLVHNVSSQTVMGVVQQLADVASERVDVRLNLLPPFSDVLSLSNSCQQLIGVWELPCMVHVQ